MQRQRNRGIGQVVGVGFVDHLERGAEVGLPQKSDTLGQINAGTDPVFYVLDDGQPIGCRGLHPCPKGSVVAHDRQCRISCNLML